MYFLHILLLIELYAYFAYFAPINLDMKLFSLLPSLLA